MSKCCVSVVIPIYNMENYLKRCVDSVLGQDYKNIEIILVNDGSTDGTIDICDFYAQKYNNIVVINQENSGPSVARNEGIKNANGEWIMFVDPDDYLSSNIVSTLLSNITSITDIISCTCFVDDGIQKFESHFFDRDITATSSDEKIIFFKQLLDYSYAQKDNIYTAIGVPWGKLYRKEFLLRKKLEFDPSLRRMQDNIFNTYAFFYAREFKYVDIPLYFYNFQHMSSSIKTYRYRDIQIEYNKVIGRKKTIIDLDLLNIYPELKEFFVNELSMFFCRIVKLIMLCNDTDMKKKKRINMLRKYVDDDIFSDLFDNINLLSNKKNSLIIKLVLKKHYNMLSILYKINDTFSG